MNCDEIKNLLGECESLAELSQIPAAAAHFKSCAGCRAALRYEEKLRQSFISMVIEAPPPDLAARIMAIQAEHPVESNQAAPATELGWFDLLLRSLQGFPFKVALAAGLTGFFAAVLIMHQPQLAPVQAPVEMAKRREPVAPAPADDRTVQPELPAKEEQISSAGKSMQMAMLKEEKQHETEDKLTQLTRSAPQQAAEKNNEAESLNEEHIPGAMTFALDSSADSFVPESSADADSGAAALADQPAASEPEMQMAMAPSESSEMARSVTPSAAARFAAPPPGAGVRARISASQILSEGKSKKSELSDEMFAESERSDPLADELRELIETNAIDLPEGFISLDELAMLGYLPAEQLRRLAPPAGSGWYLQKTASQLRVFLKKR